MLSTHLRSTRIGANSTTIAVHLGNKVTIDIGRSTSCLHLETEWTTISLFADSLDELARVVHLMQFAIDERRGELAMPPTPDEIDALRAQYAVEVPF